jgi:hypothetical protein
MSANYASILASKYQSHSDTSMQGEVELAFVVVDILSEAGDATDEWRKLLKSARDLLKTRAKRSRTKFRMQFKKALENSDLAPTLELPGKDLPVDREDKFRLRLANPQFMSRRTQEVISKPVIVPSTEAAIIKEDKPCTKEREDEFSRRLTHPGSFRRSN